MFAFCHFLHLRTDDISRKSLGSKQVAQLRSCCKKVKMQSFSKFISGNATFYNVPHYLNYFGQLIETGTDCSIFFAKKLFS
jgi:hypothetical protein